MKPSSRKPALGFTLVELLVVLAILGLLATVVAPGVMKQLSAAKTKAVALQIHEFGSALDAYNIDQRRYPATDQGLDALVKQPGNAPDWNGPYLKKVPKDSWGNEYNYRAPGQHGDYDIWSLGADSRDGGEGENRDVVSWE